MRIISSNVSGLNNTAKLHTTINQVRSHDIVLLQETKLTMRSIPMLQLKWRHPSGVFLASENVAARRGVITLFSPKLRVQHLYSHGDTLGQFLVNVLIIDSNTYMVLNIYLDPDSDNHASATLDRISNILDNINQRFAITHTIVGGDFNLVLHRSDTHSTTRKPQAEARLSSIVTDNRWYDVAPICSDTPKHTYFRYRNERTSARYDRFYVSSNLTEGIKYRTLQRQNDHSPILVEVLQQKRGQGLWRFQDTLLENEYTIMKLENSLRSTISSFVDTEEENLSNLQKHINYDQNQSIKVLSKIITDIRKIAIEETKRNKINRNQKEKEALDYLILIRQQYNDAPLPDENLTQALEEAQLKLKSLQQKRAQYASLRNHINYALNGEKTTAYHFAMAKTGKPSRDIKKLIVNSPNGARILTNEEIIEYMTNKYTEIASIDHRGISWP